MIAAKVLTTGWNVNITTPGNRIAPSILSADFSRLGEAVALMESGGVEMIHLDVMDGHFVPNISFGVPVIKSLRPKSKLFFDAHLMISDPLKYAEPFVRAGCDLITFHIETTDRPKELVQHIRSLGAMVGVSLNPTTPASSIDAIVHDVDLVLVMSVWPGFGGQSFITDVLPKVSELKNQLSSRQRLEIDGGIDAKTITLAASAGADTFVAGTAIFGQANPLVAMHELHRLANQTIA